MGFLVVVAVVQFVYCVLVGNYVSGNGIMRGNRGEGVFWGFLFGVEVEVEKMREGGGAKNNKIRKTLLHGGGVWALDWIGFFVPITFPSSST